MAVSAKAAGLAGLAVGLAVGGYIGYVRRGAVAVDRGTQPPPKTLPSRQGPRRSGWGTQRPKGAPASPTADEGRGGRDVAATQRVKGRRHTGANFETFERGETMRRARAVFGTAAPRSKDEMEKRKAAKATYKAEQRRLSNQANQQKAQRTKEHIATGAEAQDVQGSVVVPKRLLRAETVLQRRTSRFILVLESSFDTRNQEAVLRTAEAMGVQRVHIIQAEEEKNHKHSTAINKGSEHWLTLTRFTSTADCIQSLRDEGAHIWATDLHPEALCLRGLKSDLPDKLAVVIGREADGVSPMMLAAADKRVYLRMHGFTESYNLSVAAALVLHSLFDACPAARGDMGAEEKTRLRREWHAKLNRTASSVERAAELLQLAESGEMGQLPNGDLRVDDVHAVPRIPPKIRTRLSRGGQDRHAE